MKKYFRLILFGVLLVLVIGSYASAVSWSGPLSPSIMPGSGLIQTQSSFLLPDGSALLQAVWRGDQGFSRTIPVINGSIDWNQAGSWSGPMSISELPGSGSMQSQEDFVLPDRSGLLQAFWRGNQGFCRTVPIINNRISWGSAQPWSGPIPISSLPGSGDVQGQQSILVSSRNYYFQMVCRGGNLYYRTAPVVNNVIQWNSSSEFYGPISADNFLPGSGPLLAMDSFVAPNGTDVVLGYWRGDTADTQTGYTRKIQLSYPNGFSLVENGTSNLGWIFDTRDCYTIRDYYYYRGDDYYNKEWSFNYWYSTIYNVRAAAPGIVVYAGYNGYNWDYQYHVIVQCLDNPRFAYLYAWLYNIDVKVGDIVGFDTLIGHAQGPVHEALYQKISTTDGSYSNIRINGIGPSGSLVSWQYGQTPSKYAAPFNTLP